VVLLMDLLVYLRVGMKVPVRVKKTSFLHHSKHKQVSESFHQGRYVGPYRAPSHHGEVVKDQRRREVDKKLVKKDLL
jgi:hypothetical protein